MKVYFAFLLVLFYCSLLTAQNPPTWVWAESGGGTAYDLASSVCVSNNGEVYITGTFTGNTTFGTTIITGDNDVFIAKLDSNGNWLWVRSAGGPGCEGSWKICTDNNGFCYVIGSHSMDAVFGTTTLTSQVFTDIFVTKLDSDGNWIWAKSAGGPETDEGCAITTDDTGNVYVTGIFVGTAVFGTTSLTSSNNSRDAFVAKLDSNGNWLWAKRCGSSNDDNCLAVTVDAAENLYLAGNVGGPSMFGTIPTPSWGFCNLFVAKLDSNGNWQWAKSAGGESVYNTYMTTDSTGTSFITGSYCDTLYFGNHTISNNGSVALFLAKINAQGTWQNLIQTSGNTTWGKGISLDNEGGLYLTGSFSGNVMIGQTSLVSTGNLDIFAAKMNPFGAWQWAVKAGGTAMDDALGVAVDTSGRCYIAGYYYNTCLLGDISLPNYGLSDALIAKLSSDGTLIDDNENPYPPISVSCNPNPFIGQLKITFTGKLKSSPVLTIFNIKGQKVRSYSDIKGNELIWDGCDEKQLQTGAGIYLLRLDTEKGTQFRKVMKLK